MRKFTLKIKFLDWIKARTNLEVQHWFIDYNIITLEWVIFYCDRSHILVEFYVGARCIFYFNLS